jgi:ATP-dependent protease ClpP protease subunit
MAHQWFTAKSSGAGTGEILIFDEIRSDGGVSAKDFDAQLKALGRMRLLTLRINSPGGDVPQAAAIVNMLERLKANGTFVSVRIEGVAASAASWIAMVGHEVIMPENTLMMIHSPSSLVVGNATDMRDIASVLDKVRDAMVGAYVAKSRKSRAEVEAIMEAETWFSASEAVAAGFADRVEQPIAIAAVHDLTKFKQPPKAPTTMAELADQFWARQGKPAPRTATETLGDLTQRVWAREGNVAFASFGTKSSQG